MQTIQQQMHTELLCDRNILYRQLNFYTHAVASEIKRIAFLNVSKITIIVVINNFLDTQSQPTCIVHNPNKIS